MKRKLVLGAAAAATLLVGLSLLVRGRAPAASPAGARPTPSFDVGITTAQEIRNMLTVYGERVEATERELVALRKQLGEAHKRSEDSRKNDLSAVEKMMRELQGAVKSEPVLPPPGPPRFRTFEFEKARGRSLHIPAGSFGEATLLTGVFAPTSGEALPVLLRLDAALVGPQRARIPLRGAFLVGKAQGDANSSRAVVQIETLSALGPDGRSLEAKVNGWVADDDGAQGLRGAYVWHAGEILTLSAATGALSGGADAMAQRETTPQVTPLGGVQAPLTGDPLKFTGYRALSTAFGRLGEMVGQRLNEIVPAVHVANGRRVTVAFISGATLDGYEPPPPPGSPYEGLDR